ncbi:MAG: hypothetical protein WAO58_01720 [Fimbriimonadaceae bacterium]
MTQKQKDTWVRQATILIIAGPAVTFGSFMCFFGGSSNDPSWAWTLFGICFFGGLAVGAVGLLMLVILGFQKPDEPPPSHLPETAGPSSDASHSEEGDG